jgi:hypothetical protein
MIWCNVQRSWHALWGRLVAPQNKSKGARLRRGEYLRKSCGISKEEANRRMKDWIREPGVLDDWNDTRSILDM